MERTEAPDVDFDALLRSLTREARRREILRHGSEIASQILSAVDIVHARTLWLVYSPDLVICQTGGEGWAIDPASIVGKDLWAAFGPELGDEFADHYRAGLRGQHVFDATFVGERWRSLLRPLIESQVGLVGAVLLCRPLEAWEGTPAVGDPTRQDTGAP